MENHESRNKTPSQEIKLKAISGMPILLLNILILILTIPAVIIGVVQLDEGSAVLGWILLGVSIFYWCLPTWLLFAGLKVVRPNEALVMTLFGRYIGTLKGEGFYFVNPFAVPIPLPPRVPSTDSGSVADQDTETNIVNPKARAVRDRRRLSLKTMALNNNKQKVNDKLGNPVIISIVVIWRVADTAKAMFDVENFSEFLSIQCDSALRNIAQLYPYDSEDTEDANEKSLRGSTQEFANKLSEEIQSKVEIAGLEILEARITHLAYAPEIAAAMLQRQQASAIVDARQLIVEGAVGMVEMALDKLKAQGVVELDEERKAAMVSNLMVVLCGNREAQPIVNSGSLY